MIAYANCFKSGGEKGPSFTDALLCNLAYKYRHLNMLIMSANHKDMPLKLFERIELITLDIAGSLRNEAIYRFVPERLNKALEAIA
jgi:hypothetical protein